jgi:hypothetical protein
MPEAVAPGDMGPANVHMGSANVYMAASAEVPSSEVTAAEVAPTEVTAAEVATTEVATTKVTAASVSATSMTASTTGKGRHRDCRTTQKDSSDSYEQCFSQHQDLHHHVSNTKLYRRIFSVIDAIISGQCSSTTS